MVGVLGGGRFWGNEVSALDGSVFPVPGMAFLIIRSSVENPSGVFSANALRLRSLDVSVLVKDVGGSGFIVRVSGAPKFKDGIGLFEGSDGKTCSRNLQLANLALSRFPVAGSR